MSLRRLLPLAVLVALLAIPLSSASAETLHMTYGPIHIVPGQNTIDIRTMIGAQKPPGPGYITSFHPDLKYSGTDQTPPVDVVHLHHGVWLVNGAPTWAAGEEKTAYDLPKGFGWHYDPSQKWWLNYMIHNLTPTATNVDMTWTMDFVPDSSPEAAGMQKVDTQWLDVEGGKAYPVFDALKGSGNGKTYTFPNDDPTAYAPDGNRQLNTWTVNQDSTLIGTAGHVHPGGLNTRLWDTRDGQTRLLFRSDAHYFEPAGATSWDVAMTNTPKNWRINVKKGDVLSVTGTYDVSQASWYESMAIMPVAIARGTQTGVDPFTHKVTVTGPLNHGHLPENDHHGGGEFGLPDATAMVSGNAPGNGTVNISNFLYGQGDLNVTGPDGRPPTVKQGQSITFKNLDSLPGGNDATAIFHTITACKAPCNRETGIAYPLANGPVTFDSGELGYGPTNFTPAANKQTWATPDNLPTGTYTYFCRIHPFMRGAFRVVPR